MVFAFCDLDFGGDLLVAEFHFVEDYEKFVAQLVKDHPMDEAMRIAVGGNFEAIGNIASDIVVYAGARDGMSALDFGCGCGRVAAPLSKKVKLDKFLGIDVVQQLLDYAKLNTPNHYEYRLNRSISIPANEQVFDIAYAFSVFTHLLQTECYRYLCDIYRTLKPGGRLVLSFLELNEPRHWKIFEASDHAKHLNTFIERSQWDVWANRSGFSVVEYIGAYNSRWNGHALGQSVAILQKP